MRKIAMGLLALTVAGVGGIMALRLFPVAAPVTPITLVGDVASGGYLARASGCIACHTDVKGGGRPLAGGTGFETQFGTVYAPNLTTDVEYGIGDWTIEDFAKAVRQGLSPDDIPAMIQTHRYCILCIVSCLT